MVFEREPRNAVIKTIMKSDASMASNNKHREAATITKQCRHGDTAQVQMQYTGIVLTVRFRGEREE